MFNFVFKNKILNKFAIRFSVWLNNFSYKLISRLVVLEGNGIHPKHRILDYHQFFIDNVTSEDSILDIGCGTGAVAFDLSKNVKEIVGVDIQQKNIDQATKLYQCVNLHFFLGDATVFQFDKKFDKIVLSNVLEHIANRVGFLLSLHRISDTIILRVPLINRDWLVVYKKEKDYEYRLDPTHFIEYTLSLLNHELEQSGWKLMNHSVQWGELWGVVQSSSSV